MGFKTHSTRWNSCLAPLTGEELVSEEVIGTTRDLLLICWMNIALAALYMLIFIPETSAALRLLYYSILNQYENHLLSILWVSI